MKTVILREASVRDVDQAISHYLSEGGEQAALDFIDAVERAYDHLGRHPGAGSLRYSHVLDIPGLRSWSLGRFPYVAFYVEGQDHVDVWRVLHNRRDIPAWMQEPGEG